MINKSRASVICLCHNQADFVEEAIHSALNQTHENIELIVVDDGSTDGSKQVIRKAIQDLSVEFVDIERSVGNCKAFNQGLQYATGEYIIDLAADDKLLPNRVAEGIKTFSTKTISVEFCNVRHIDHSGNEKNEHFDPNQEIPEGDLYEKLITTYFISPPGMMMKKEVLDELGGYDESLTYEDFDFWIRSSRKFEYGYTDKVLVQKRDIPNSLSKKQFQFLSKHQRSTLKVCKKIKKLNRYRREDLALRKRCLYEIKNCLKQGNIGLIPSFLRLCF